MTNLARPIDPRVSLNGVYDLDAALEADVDLCRQTGITKLGIIDSKIDRLGPRESVRLVEGASLGVTTICHPSAFTLDDPGRWADELVSAKRSVDYAVALGAPTVYATTGPRGQLTWDRAAAAFVDAVADWASYASDHSVQLLIEPTTHFGSDLSILHTLGDVVSLANAAGVGICLDAFACWYDSTFATCLDAAVSRCGLVQVSDYTLGERYARVRAVPGDGIIDWHAIFAALSASSYAGNFDIELLGDHAEGMASAFRRAAIWITERLVEYPMPGDTSGTPRS